MLSGELHGYMNVFLARNTLVLRRLRVTTTGTSLVERDVIAMACVIAVLKLLYGFNGVKERCALC